MSSLLDASPSIPQVYVKFYTFQIITGLLKTNAEEVKTLIFWLVFYVQFFSNTAKDQILLCTFGSSILYIYCPYKPLLFYAFANESTFYHQARAGPLYLLISVMVTFHSLAFTLQQVEYIGYPFSKYHCLPSISIRTQPFRLFHIMKSRSLHLSLIRIWLLPSQKSTFQPLKGQVVKPQLVSYILVPSSKQATICVQETPGVLQEHTPSLLTETGKANLCGSLMIQMDCNSAHEARDMIRERTRSEVVCFMMDR